MSPASGIARRAAETQKPDMNPALNPARSMSDAESASCAHGVWTMSGPARSSRRRVAAGFRSRRRLEISSLDDEDADAMRATRRETRRVSTDPRDAARDARAGEGIGTRREGMYRDGSVRARRDVSSRAEVGTRVCFYVRDKAISGSEETAVHRRPPPVRRAREARSRGRARCPPRPSPRPTPPRRSRRASPVVTPRGERRESRVVLLLLVIITVIFIIIITDDDDAPSSRPRPPRTRRR